MLAYIEIMLHDYHFTLAQIFGVDPRDSLLLEAGFALLDARHHRQCRENGADPGPGYVQSEIAATRAQMRRHLESAYRIIPGA